MYTVEQAKSKICPIRSEGRGACKIEECMAWRWATVAQMSAAGHEAFVVANGIGPGVNYVEKKWPVKNISPMGYCGHFGLPECMGSPTTV